MPSTTPYNSQYRAPAPPPSFVALLAAATIDFAAEANTASCACACWRAPALRVVVALHARPARHPRLIDVDLHVTRLKRTAIDAP